MFDGQSDELSIANPDDAVRNLTSQPAGFDIFLQSVDGDGGRLQDFKETPFRDGGDNAVRQQEKIVTLFYQTAHRRYIGVPGDVLSVWSIQASETQYHVKIIKPGA